MLGVWLVVATAAAAVAQPRTIALVGGTLIHTDGHEPLPNAVVIVEGERIAKVGLLEDVRIPDGAEVIRAVGKWIVPGLIDAHIHFFQSGGLYTRPDVIDLRTLVSYDEERAAIDARLPDTFARYLACGITSVADMGGPFWNFSVRERAQATAAAPRVAITGPLISTYQPDALTTEDPPILKVHTPAEAEALVERQVPHKPDFIKIWFIVQGESKPADHLPVIRAVVEASHRHSLRVAVHATELETARVAVEAGADILVHSVFDRPVDEAFVALLKERRVVYCPTLLVMGRYREVFTQQLRLHAAEHERGHPGLVSTLFDLRRIPLEQIPARRRVLLEKPEPVESPAVALANLKTLFDAGVTIAAGTDAGNIGTLHGPSLFREFELMAEAGMQPIDILRSATVGGAVLMGRGDELGQIRPGMLADLVVLGADPIRDLRNLNRVHLVMKGGQAFRPTDLVPESAGDVVQRQVNAYNARDLEAFVETFSTDVELFWLGERKPYATGRGELRTRYGRFFAENPKVHCEVVRRICQSSHVIDQEKVTGLAQGEVLEATAIYQVELGRIRRVWFVR
ncbi:MAG: amidohydrolase family protein [Planctomycetes bacterium]|nr:amidohydrolase family protein [Planctomycetota bacterium]